MVERGRSVFDTVCAAIKRETGFEGDITKITTADHIDGWDSIAHITIMYRIEVLLGVSIDMRETYEASNIGELAEMIEGKIGQ